MCRGRAIRRILVVPEALLIPPPAAPQAAAPTALVVKIHSATQDAALALAEHDDVRIAARGATGTPDVILVVDDPPALDGLETMRALKRRPGCPPVVMVSRSAGRLLMAAIEGARGTLLGVEPHRALRHALRAAAAGHAVVAPALHRELAAREHARGAAIARARRTLDSLSERELEVARHIAAGMSNADISERLHVSEGTVKTYVTRTLGKLRIGSRTQLAAIVHRADLAL
jgi:DNA-binding NarL/FixJ family response regulator